MAGIGTGLMCLRFVGVLALAEHLIETQGLGSDAIPDVLAFGFSSLDLVGHQYGPNSREALDTVLRLDLCVSNSQCSR